MKSIDAKTKPTLDDVKKGLEAGKYKETANTFALADLAQQLFRLQPVAERYADAFKKAGFADVDERLVTSHRLLELAGYMSADRATIRSRESRRPRKLPNTAARSSPPATRSCASRAS